MEEIEMVFIQHKAVGVPNGTKQLLKIISKGDKVSGKQRRNLCNHHLRLRLTALGNPLMPEEEEERKERE